MELAFAAFIALSIAILTILSIAYAHHDPGNCRVCAGRRAQERLRRADDAQREPWQ